MKKFKFKFESILNLRKRREDDALRVLGAAQGAHQRELARKVMLQKELSDSLARRELLGQIPVGVVAFRVEQDFIVGTKARITQQEQAIIRASRGVEKALRAYLFARRQTRMMETLYEKDHREFKKERAKREQREIEDLVTMRARLKEASA